MRKMSSIEERYKLIANTYVDVVKYLRKFNLSSADFEDAVQDTMIDAFSHVRSLRDESKVRNWMIAIAKSNGIKYARKRKKIKTRECAFNEDVIQLECNNLPDDEVLKEIFQSVDNVYLYEALKSLKPRERDVIILQHVYGHKQEYVAEIVGETLANTKSISSRAKAKLRKYLVDGGYVHGR
jgi:RNA polymerase sigma factor (sigma-70 family)